MVIIIIIIIIIIIMPESIGTTQPNSSASSSRRFQGSAELGFCRLHPHHRCVIMILRSHMEDWDAGLGAGLLTEPTGLKRLTTSTPLTSSPHWLQRGSLPPRLRPRCRGEQKHQSPPPTPLPPRPAPPLTWGEGLAGAEDGERRGGTMCTWIN